MKLRDALEKMASCNFECEAGPLTKNVGWLWLESASKSAPEYLPGQHVWFEIEAEAAGKKLTQWVQFCIVGCAMDSDTERQFWTYSLSYDPPQPYHYGTTHFSGVRGDKLRLVGPAS